MTSNQRIWPFFLVIAAVSVTLLGFFALWAPEGAEERTRFRLAINPWPSYELLYLAGVRKLYEQEGLDVELIQFSTLDDARRSFERGQVDAVATTLVDVVQIFQDTGEAPKIILALDYSDGGDVVVALQGRARDVRSLRGKTIGVEQNFGRFILDRALQGAGLTLDDVRLVETSVLGASNLLKRGSVDAIVTYAPYVFDALKVEGTRAIFSTKDAPEQVFDVVATRAEHLARIPDLQARLTRTWKRAMDFAESEPQLAHEIMARRERISVEEFKTAMTGLKLIPAGQQASMLARRGPIAKSLEALMHFKGWNASMKISGVSSEHFLVHTQNSSPEE